jgi:uncharacterized membrane protein
MYTYYFLFSLIFMLVNVGYAFAQLGEGSERYFSVPLLVISAAVCIGSLVWIRRRFQRRDAKALNAKPADNK